MMKNLYETIGLLLAGLVSAAGIITAILCIVKKHNRFPPFIHK